jgi:hypothetical protein
MNERTVELYKQATEFAYNSIGREHANTAYFQGAITGKFAELIVRECMTVARGADGLDATHEAWYLIEQHFGIGMSTEDKKTLIKELLGVKND